MVMGHKALTAYTSGIDLEVRCVFYFAFENIPVIQYHDTILLCCGKEFNAQYYSASALKYPG